MSRVTQFPRHRRNSQDPDPADIHIGNLLRLHREIKGLAPGELAAAVGLLPQALQAYETAEIPIPASILHRVAMALNLPIFAFYGEETYNFTATSICSEEITLYEILALISEYRAIPTGEMRHQVFCRAKALAAYGIPKGVRNAAE